MLVGAGGLLVWEDMTAVKEVGVVMLGWCEMLRDSLGIESGMSVEWDEGGK